MIKGKLSQAEQKYFIDRVPNNASLFKGSIFLNDKHRDEELKMEFVLNSKYDGLNITKQVEFGSLEDLTHSNGSPALNGISSQVKIRNLLVKVSNVRNNWSTQYEICHLDVTFDAIWSWNSKSSPFQNSLLPDAHKNDLKFRILLESSDPKKTCFPDRV